MGITQARDADELGPAEGINLPIVYNIHSNFIVMKHAADQDISSIGFQKLIQGGQGPFARHGPDSS